MHFDYFDQTLEVGDLVAFSPPSYRNFETGKIIKLTGCYAFIEYVQQGRATSCKQPLIQIIKKYSQEKLKTPDNC